MIVNWEKEAKEIMKTQRFCPQCGNLVKLVFRQHKCNQSFFDCSICGETILVIGEYLLPNNRWE